MYEVIPAYSITFRYNICNIFCKTSFEKRKDKMLFFPELNKANKNTDFHKTDIVLNANVFTNENGNIAVQREFIKSSKTWMKD